LAPFTANRRQRNREIDSDGRPDRAGRPAGPNPAQNGPSAHIPRRPGGCCSGMEGIIFPFSGRKLTCSPCLAGRLPVGSPSDVGVARCRQRVTRIQARRDRIHRLSKQRHRGGKNVWCNAKL